MHMTVYLHLTLVDLKSISMLLKLSKYCARRMKKISISCTLKLVFGRISKIDIILKTNEYLKTKNEQYYICQKAISTRQYSFYLAILTEICYFGYFIQDSILFKHPVVKNVHELLFTFRPRS